MNLRKSRLILFGLLAVVALLAIALVLLRPGEPSYRGKRLSAWFDELYLTPAPEETPAEWEARWARLTNVVRSIGTNALPFYMRCLNYQPRPEWYNRLGDWVAGHTSGRVYLPWLKDRMVQAQTCIQILGPAAEPVIPDLARLVSNEYSGWAAAQCLASIGPAALPVLSNAVATASDRRIRYWALEAMGILGPDARPASPLLLELVHAREPDVGLTIADLALRALVECDTNAVALMPLLVKCLADTNTAPGAAYGLARLGTPGIPVLLQAITNEDSKIRAAAAAALEMGFHKYSADPSARFGRFHTLFNLKLIRAVWGSYSDHEYRSMETVLQRYAAHRNEQVRIAATNALAHLRSLGTNAPPISPPDPPG